MFNYGKKRVWVLAGVFVAAIATVLVTQNATQAEEEAGAMIVGTFEPGTVAQQTGLQEKMREQMAGLQQRMQAAQQEGDQAAMQKIQGEAQQIQKTAVESFQSSIDEALPTVAKAAGVQIIAVEVSYMAPGVESKDLTNAVIAEMGGEAPAPAPEQQLVLPQQSQ